ncbi:MAG TPA: hypothetical protein DIU20_09965, partial [Cryomorphaceae bacterium]|nr:hypothetical protein [Cryomorphaceae bacterium]
DFDPGTATFNLTSTGFSDVFISKLDPAGNFIWAKKLGGTGYDGSRSITTDAFGNVYTTGFFQGTVDFDPGTATFNLTSAGFSDAFISKLDTAGNFVWAKKWGGVENDQAFSITTDASGNVYTTGYFQGTVDFDPATATFNLTSAGKSDVFISKLDTAGNFVWAKKWGGVEDDQTFSITTDASGNVYTTGYFQGTVDFDPATATFNLTSAGFSDAFISKLDTAGNFMWAKRLGGAEGVQAWSITTDASGNVYTTGFFRGTCDFDPGTGTFNLISAGVMDVFISKLDTAGNFVWAKQLGGTHHDIGTSITTDASGNVYTTGSFEADTVDFDPGAGTYNLISAGLIDVFISKLDATGNFVWAKKLGGANSEAGLSIITDASGNVYTTGHFRGTCDFDPGTASFNLTSAGSSDVFIHKISQCGNATGSISPIACNSYISPSSKYTWTASGTYMDTIPGSTSCDSVITVNLTIRTVDTSVTNTSPTLMANGSGATYQWLDCGKGFAVISGATNQNYTATANGNYAVAVTQNGCTDTSTCELVANVGILENSFGNGLTFYPNPTSGKLSIDLGTSYSNVFIIVRNVLGQEVISKSFKGLSLLQFNIPGEAGVYLVEVKFDNQSSLLKVMKK